MVLGRVSEKGCMESSLGKGVLRGLRYMLEP